MDIICYIENLIDFRAEALEQATSGSPSFSIDSENNLSYNVNRIPVFYNGLESLCLTRFNQSELEAFNTLETIVKIGVAVNGEYIFDDGGQEIYERVYPREEIEDEDGNISTPPYMLGLFA